MSQTTKTLAFIAAAGVLFAFAFATRPTPPTPASIGGSGQSLFTDWKEPQAARSIEITTVDASNRASELKVADENGQWVIPSHGGFPANAQAHVVKAAQALVNMKIFGDPVSDAPGDHETYGVVEPTHDQLQPAPPGAGKLVVVRDASGTALAKLIIGKSDRVPGSEASNLHFVRIAGQDRVYRVDIPADVFSSNFSDWVDTDLLGLKQHWDITNMNVRDYSMADSDQGVVIDRNSDINLKYDDAKAAWTVAKLTEYKDNKPTAHDKVPDGEELEVQKLNDAKMSLSGLKIVDVVPKSKTLAGELKKDEPFYADQRALRTLAGLGMLAFPPEMPNDLFSIGGDMSVAMKDGVEYTIHFGGVQFGSKEQSEQKTAADAKSGKDAAAGKTDDTDKKDSDKKDSDKKDSDKKDSDKKDSDKKDSDKKDDAAGKSGGIAKAIAESGKAEKEGKSATETQRAVFVTARFNPDLIPKPALELLPAAKAGGDTKPAETNKTEPAAGDKKPDKNSDKKPDQPSAETKTDDKKPAAPPAGDTDLDKSKAPPADTKDAKQSGKSDETFNEDQAADNKSTGDSAGDKKPADAPKAADNKPVDAKATDAKPTDSKPTDAKPADDAKSPADQKPATDKKPDAGEKTGDKKPESGIKRAEEEEKQDAERKRIEAANKQKTDQYNESIKKGQQHAKELNDRFAGWFYFISEDDYKKVHLTRAEIIKEKPAAKDDKTSPLGPGLTDPFKRKTPEKEPKAQ